MNNRVLLVLVAWACVLPDVTWVDSYARKQRPMFISWKTPGNKITVKGAEITPYEEVNEILGVAPPVTWSPSFKARCQQEEQQAVIHMTAYANHMLQFDTENPQLKPKGKINVMRMNDIFGDHMSIVSDFFQSTRGDLCCVTVVKPKTYLMQLYFYCGWTTCYPAGDGRSITNKDHETVCHFPDVNYYNMWDRHFKRCLISVPLA